MGLDGIFFLVGSLFDLVADQGLLVLIGVVPNCWGRSASRIGLAARLAARLAVGEGPQLLCCDGTSGSLD